MENPFQSRDARAVQLHWLRKRVFISGKRSGVPLPPALFTPRAPVAHSKISRHVSRMFPLWSCNLLVCRMTWKKYIKRECVLCSWAASSETLAAQRLLSANLAAINVLLVCLLEERDSRSQMAKVISRANHANTPHRLMTGQRVFYECLLLLAVWLALMRQTFCVTHYTENNVLGSFTLQLLRRVNYLRVRKTQGFNKCLGWECFT